MDGSCDSPRLISVALVWLESLEFLAFDDAFELAFDEQPASVPTEHGGRQCGGERLA